MTMSHRNSLIWDYFSNVVGENKVANCNQCSKNLSYRTSITNLKTHLKVKHIGHYNSYLAESEPTQSHSVQVHLVQIADTPEGALQPVKPEAVQPTSPPSIYEEYYVGESQQEITVTASETQSNILDNARKSRKPLRTEDKKHIDAMLLKLIAKTYQPFNIVDEPDFVEFVEALNPKYVLPGRKVISERLIPFLYNKCLEEQKIMLHKEAVTICLSTDCWTSVKMDPFICVTAHFINNEFEFKSVLLKCSVISGAQTSQNLAIILRKTCMEWDILDKINFCVTDNAENIVGAINILGWKHCGCMAHRLNLTLQQSLNVFDEILKKVKKIVTYYRYSCKAKEELMEYQVKEKGPSEPVVFINSVPTIWNSTYFMIERFVHFQDAIRETTPNLKVDLPIITGKEWTSLKQLCKVLKPFDDATKELSGEKYVYASKAIAVISGLKDVMQELKRKPANFDAIKNVVECLETQLNNRFQDLEHQQCLALCTILDPRYKISMFIDESAAEGTKSRLVQKVFKLIVTEETGITTPPETADPLSSKVNDDGISLWRKRNLFLENRRINPNPNLLKIAQHEVESYLQDEFAQNSCDPSEWWRSSGRYKYPHLGELFKTNCNIVATSVPSEGLFSKAGSTLSERRTRYSVKKTEQLVFLNFNLKNCDYKRLMPKI